MSTTTDTPDTPRVTLHPDGSVKLPAEVTDLPALLRYVADTWHGGQLLPIAVNLRMSPGVVSQWSRGVIRSPRPAAMLALAGVYHLRIGEVLAAVYGDESAA